MLSSNIDSTVKYLNRESLKKPYNDPVIDVTTVFRNMVKESNTNIDAYQPHIFAALFPYILPPDVLARHEDEFMRDENNVLWRRIIQTEVFETDLAEFKSVNDERRLTHEVNWLVKL